MRYVELLERVSMMSLERAATEALSRVMTPMGRNDVLFHYQENVAAPVLEVLRTIATEHQDPAHPIKLYLDFHKRGTDFGSFNEDGDDGFVVIELYAILRATLDLDSSKWDRYESVMDLRQASKVIADVFAHEMLHYRQHLGSWGKERRKVSSRVFKSRPTNQYLSQSNEIQAYATDAARQLRQSFGAEAITAVRDGRAKQASSAFRKYADLGSSTVFRAFLHHLAQALMVTEGVMRLSENEEDEESDTDYEARMGRARSMGFDPDDDWYHGTARPITQFDASLLGSTTGARNAVLGFFFTNDEWQASAYAGRRGQVIDVLLRMRKPLLIKQAGDYVDTGDVGHFLDEYVREYEQLSRYPSEEDYAEFRRTLQGRGYDSIIVQLNPQHRVAVVFDASQIRDRDAEFDPAKTNGPNLLD